MVLVARGRRAKGEGRMCEGIGPPFAFRLSPFACLHATCRSAVTTERRAARMAGTNPDTVPMTTAATKAVAMEEAGTRKLYAKMAAGDRFKASTRSRVKGKERKT